MRLSDEKSLLEQMTIEQARQNIALLKAEEIEMPKKWVLELLNTIEALQQENKQLKAKLDEWKYEAKCHMDEVVARDKEIGKLRAQAARMREILEQFKYDYEQNCPIHQNYLAACRLLREDTVQAYHNPGQGAGESLLDT